MGFVKEPFLDEVQKDYNATMKGWGITNLYVELGLYYEQIKRYFDVFTREQIHIILYDDLKNNTEKVCKKLFDFLSLEYQDDL